MFYFLKGRHLQLEFKSFSPTAFANQRLVLYQVILLWPADTATGYVLQKSYFLNNSQRSQENISARSKKTPWQKDFLVSLTNFYKHLFYRTAQAFAPEPPDKQHKAA